MTKYYNLISKSFSFLLVVITLLFSNQSIGQCTPDVTNPVVICNDTSVYLDANGEFAFDTSYVVSSVFDACELDSVWLSDILATCGMDTLMVTVYAQDTAGNLDSCMATVLVFDTLAPTIACLDTTVYLDITGQFNFDTSYVLDSAFDICGVDSVWLSDTSATCGMDTLMVTVYARDTAGNIDSCMATVVVLDTIAPIIACLDTTVYLDATGEFDFDTSYVLDFVVDICGVDSVWLSDTLATCSTDTIMTTVYARDTAGNIDSCMATVLVMDTLAPTVACLDTTIYLDSSGQMTIDTSYVFDSAMDNCGVDSIWISDSVILCGMDTVMITVYARDTAGNIDSCMSTVVVMDTVPPSVVCTDTTVYLDANGEFILDSTYVIANVTSLCGIDSVWLSDTLATCGMDTLMVTVYARDSSNNIDSCIATVLVMDTLAPTITCIDTTVYLNTAGEFDFDTSYVVSSVMDNCGVDSVWLSDTLATCGVDTLMITVYAQDTAGNIDSCMATVLVMDTLAPTIACLDTTVYLDASGEFAFDTSYVFDSAMDNCGVDSIWLSDTLVTCGMDTLMVTVYAQDSNGNIDSCMATVVILDTLAPTIACLDTTVYLDVNGQVIIDTSYVLDSVVDVCGIDSVWLSDTIATCNMDTLMVTIYAQDTAGNIDSCMATVVILDTLAPAITCLDTTVYLDANGEFAFDTSYVFDSAMDNCGVDSIWISDTLATCGMDTLMVTIYAQDTVGNIDSCMATVLVMDTLAPTIACLDTTIYLDSSGQMIIDTSYVFDSAMDNCGVDSIWISDSIIVCGMDTVMVTVYAQDSNGNVDSCMATVVVMDTVPPSIICADTTVYLDATGQFIIDSSYVLANAASLCGIDSVWLSDTLATCGMDTLMVTVYARDSSNNIDSCTATVLVMDTLAPTIACLDTTVYLDITGQFIFDTAYVLDSTMDNCGVDSIWLSDTLATCGMDTLMVTVYAQDSNGNIDSCMATVLVLDTLAPTIACLDTTVYLDATGQFVFDTAYVLDSAMDNCGVDSIWLSDTLATCGMDTLMVTVYAQDSNGNIDSCTATVLVMDTLAPTIACLDTTVFLDSTGQVIIDTSYVLDSVMDICGVDSVWLSDTIAACGMDTLMVTVYARDSSGNIDSCMATVLVMDSVAPTVVCLDTTIYLDSSGQMIIDTSYVLDSVFDNTCGIDSVWLSDTLIVCGMDTVMITVYAMDSSGNVDSCVATVAVMDTVPPTIVCTDTTVYLDANGQFVFDSTYVLANAASLCGIDSVWLSDTLATCGMDTLMVTVYGRDSSNNIDSCIATVIVLDTIAPVVACLDTTIYLDATGQFIFDTSYVFDSAVDVCGVDSVWLSDTIAFCGTDTMMVSVYARDSSGNIDSCMATVIVLDTVAPMVACLDTTIFLDSSGQFIIDTSFVFDSAFDACGVDSVWIVDSVITCGIDTLMITVYAMDSSGNIDSCMATVAVMDTVPPAIVCTDTTVYLDANGQFVFDSTYVLANASSLCGIDSVWLSDTIATCGMDTLMVTVYARDSNNVVDSCIATVLVFDTLAPVITCNDTTVYLDATGSFIFDTSYVLTSAIDGCGVDSVWISDTIVNCGVDTLMVTIYAQDSSGNIDSCMATVIALDTLAPTVLCLDTNVVIDSLTGIFVLDTSHVFDTAFDNCGVDSIWLSLDTLTCASADTVMVTIYARDSSGNIDSCMSTVVLDKSDCATNPPVIACNDTTIYLDITGSFVIDTSYVIDSVFDADGNIDSVWISNSTFNCANVGVNPVTVYVRDSTGLMDSCTAIVTVLDTLPPTPVCQNVTVYLDASGNASITVADIDNGTIDNCQLDTIYVNPTTFDCSNVGPNSVTLIATDIYGNTDSCTANVTVLDTLVPSITCPADQEVTLTGICQYTIPDYTGMVTVNDNCSSTSYTYTQTPTVGTVVASGTNTITIVVADSSGNIDSCNFNLTVKCEINVPDGFSPNNDGTHDVLVIQGLNDYPEAELKIFNRWGNLVYEASPYNNDWDGTKNVGLPSPDGSSDLPAGTYYYVLDLKDDLIENKVGWVFLKR